MSTRRTRASRQPELFARSTRPVIVLELNHRASGRKRLREFRLFAKDKTKAVRNKLTAQLANLVEEAHTHLGHALHAAAPHTQRLRKYAKVAHAKAKQRRQTNVSRETLCGPDDHAAVGVLTKALGPGTIDRGDGV